MSAKIVPYTKNREVIYDLLTRAKKFHCPVTATWEFEVSALEAARRKVVVDGRPLGLTACLIKATSLVLERYPRLNHHMFHGLFRKYEVAFEHIRCNLIMARKGPDGERILLPLIFERSNTLSAEEIQKQINHHRFAKLEDLPQFHAFQRVKRMPRILLSWFSYKVRSDYRFYERYFGTYGMSALASRGVTATAVSTVANTGSAFLMGGVRQRPIVRRGEVVVGQILQVATVVDHFLLDGLDIMEAMRYLRHLLREPSRLGIEPDREIDS